jgi:dihydroxyacetone synthase
MPNLNHMRPCDAEELIGAWQYALKSVHSPSMISVARDPVGPVPNTSRIKFQRGAYVLTNPEHADISLVSCGSNLHYAVAAAEELQKSGVIARLVSAPSLSIFDEQDEEYKESVFPHDGKPIVSVEEYVATVWARHVTASIGMTSFGYSASNESNYERFGLDTKGISVKVTKYLNFLKGFKGDARQAGWRQL